ncbi:MAG: hypothetical protein E6469_01785 [Clostridium perfringens]|uniref:hypothetical protein n=1 Tax=Clostridium perfringens TaxID=1502 RepID=UPI0013E2B0AA|nr:hypothetical protein [Clostridium perfringens]ELC8404166.1 hypothetical protein [Clostridium perfringens]MDH5074810.1 hypothetical protein [Clostridium perfringens]MDK0957892.1 hypothetical protein [Clostridium perfringens]MDM0501460.1 hypothetical protein [Clostridium perfringens]MDU6689530.1 hypothetical protein [Clostridium perfringens]
MIKVLELDGKQFPLKFNMGVLRRLQREKGLNMQGLFEALSIQDLDIIYKLFEEMLVDKKQYDEDFLDELSFEDFSNLITVVSELIVNSMPKEDKSKKTTKKK